MWENPRTGELEPKAHIYWRLGNPARTPEERETLHYARDMACAIIDGDTTNNPLNHGLRWPGSLHTKEHPKLCSILELNDIDIDLAEAVEKLVAGLEQYPPAEKPNRGRKEPNKDLIGHTEDIASALKVIPNQDLDYDKWRNMGLAIWGATGGTGYDLFEHWSEKSSKYDPEVCEEVWQGITDSPPNRIGKGSIFYQARQADKTWKRPREADDAAKWFERVEDDPDDQTGAKPRFKIENFDDVAAQALKTSRPFLVKGLMHRDVLAVMYGPSNVGKTFLVMDIEYHVATGRPWGGMKTCGGHVLHIFSEGGAGARYRVEALRRKYGPCPNFHMIFSDVDLFDPEADLKPLLADMSAMGVPFVLITVDTLARAMAGGDENSSKDMGTFIRNMGTMKAWTGATVLMVHHTGKDTSKGARGSNSLRNGIDTEIEITLGAVEAVKQRDLPMNWKSGFALDVVTLGRDEDGDPITSCTVRLLQDAATAEAKQAAEVSTEIALLRAILAEPAAGERRLAEMVRCGKSTANRLLKKLIKDGLVLHVLGKRKLTKKGAAALEESTADIAPPLGQAA